MASADASDLIFDIGAHKGEDSDFYLKLGYRVVAVEAHPLLAENLRARFRREIAESRYAVVDRAISDSEGDITFYVNKKVSVWGTVDPKWAKRNEGLGAESEEVTVQAVRFPEILKRYGNPHYLKVDIEGMDVLCVASLEQTDDRPKYISIESAKTSWDDLLHEFAVFEKLGYTKFKVVNQKKHRSGTFMTRGGQEISYSFEEGATGAFGEALGGAWLSKAEAIRKYRSVFLLYKTIGDNTLLQKVLGRVPFVRRLLSVVSWYDTHAMRE